MKTCYSNINTTFVKQPRILYEDNHLIAVQKRAGDIVHPDGTEDESIVDQMRHFIKERDEKPGNVYLEPVHRLDRPVSGALVFAKTSKALGRLGQQFKEGKVKKVYWALTSKQPHEPEGTLQHFLGRNKAKNMAFVAKKNMRGVKKTQLRYQLIGHLANIFLLELQPLTGRHHQIRVQLSQINCPIIGDLKYGYPKANSDKSICLHGKRIELSHPVKKEPLHIEAPLPENTHWQWFSEFDTTNFKK